MIEPQRVAQVFVEAADTLVDRFDVVEFLAMLTERCRALVDASATGIMLLDEHGSLQAMARSAPTDELGALVVAQTATGPAHDCAHTGARLVDVRVAGAAARWPDFAREAARLGVELVHAFPLRLREQTIGALTVLHERALPLGDADATLVQAVADVATIGLFHERAVREARVLAEQLQHALNSRIVIEQAKGLLAERLGVGVDEAFATLRRYARAHNRRVGEVAASVMAGVLSVSVLTAPPERGDHPER